MVSIVPLLISALVLFLPVPRRLARSATVALASVATVASWWSDGLGALLATATIAVGTVVALFALRQFEGEARSFSIPSLSMLCVAAAAATSLSRGLLSLTVAWVATSFAALAVVAASSTIQSRPSVWRTARALALSDLALVTVTSYLVVRHGLSLNEGTLSSAERHTLWVAVLVAALGRAGVTWRRSWVTETVALPTSVSALLHAGVVNAGAVAIIRVAQITPVVPWLTAGAALVGAATIVALAPRIHRRADLKGQLAVSTVSQMSFMLVMIGLGWPLLAVTHVIGHAAYKAQRFVTAAGAIESRATRRVYLPRGRELSLVARSLGVGVIAFIFIGAAMSLDGHDLHAALGVCGLAAVALWWTRSERPLPRPALYGLFCAAVGLGYPFAVELLGHLTGRLPATGYETAPWVPLVVLLVASALIVASQPRHTRSTTTERKDSYVPA